MTEYRYVIISPSGRIETTAQAPDVDAAIQYVRTQVASIAASNPPGSPVDFALFWPG